MDIGKQIKALRLKKGMTQETLADKTELSVRTIQRIENGDVNPRAYTLKMIANALEVDYNVLVDVKNDKASDEDQKTQQILANNRIALLYLSGIIPVIFPTIMIWQRNKDKVIGISDHYRAAIGYQLKVLGVIVACLWVLWKVNMFIPLIGVLFVNASISIMITTKITTSDPNEPVPIIKFGKKKILDDK